jgi:hypothetical protein
LFEDGLHRFFIGSEITGQQTYVCATPDALVKVEWKKQLKTIRDEVVKKRMAKEHEKKQLLKIGVWLSLFSLLLKKLFYFNVLGSFKFHNN